mmetsp:Transcript_15460/g.26602  ORF Transcript_15460/g.26602 Transcript_15460/m.26602 type:complete len:207 (+) Transcript_15460:935-1555(+)
MGEPTMLGKASNSTSPPHTCGFLICFTCSSKEPSQMTSTGTPRFRAPESRRRGSSAATLNLNSSASCCSFSPPYNALTIARKRQRPSPLILMTLKGSFERHSLTKFSTRAPIINKKKTPDVRATVSIWPLFHASTVPARSCENIWSRGANIAGFFNKETVSEGENFRGVTRRNVAGLKRTDAKEDVGCLSKTNQGVEADEGRVICN